VVAIGLLADPARGLKDTARAILDTGDFVLNLVSRDLAPAMNVTAVDAPRGTDELALAGLDTAPARRVAAPRIRQSPVSLECTLLTPVETGPDQILIVGRVHWVHV